MQLQSDSIQVNIPSRRLLISNSMITLDLLAQTDNSGLVAPSNSWLNDPVLAAGQCTQESPGSG